jgi:hypothetical protein
MGPVSLIYNTILNMFSKDYQKQISQLEAFIKDAYTNDELDNQEKIK